MLWEGLATKDQSGPILYDGDERFDGSVLAFAGTQISAMDNYYNNYYYHSWAHYGMGMGNPLLPGPIYNRDGNLLYRSNRARSPSLAIAGAPSEEWNYRMLMSFARHWGTYERPLDKIHKQFSSLLEVTYRQGLFRLALLGGGRIRPRPISRQRFGRYGYNQKRRRMEKIRKVCARLCLVLVFMLWAGCTGKAPEYPDLEGYWKTERIVDNATGEDMPCNRLFWAAATADCRTEGFGKQRFRYIYRAVRIR